MGLALNLGLKEPKNKFTNRGREPIAMPLQEEGNVP
jgi:hypothetical protein